MNINQRAVGGVLVLSVVGDITMRGGATQLADTVRGALQQGHTRLVLDLGSVRYVDSVGLGELVQAYAATRNRGGALTLLHVTRQLHGMLVLTHMAAVFACFDRESDAVASFERHPLLH